MALSFVISLACLILAAAFKALAESCAHGKNRWTDKHALHPDFWSGESWERKYKVNPKSTVGGDDDVQYFYPAPNTYYYKLFNLKYKERFPGSATIFVWFTDGYHAAFSMMVSFIILGVAIWTPWPIMSFFCARIVWGIAFSLAYKWVCR